MSLSWVRRFALAIAVPAAVACSNTGGSSPEPPLGQSSGPSVAFDSAGTLTAIPRQAVDVGITVTGDDAQVALWLEGDYSDASLSTGAVSTSGGHAKVT